VRILFLNKMREGGFRGFDYANIEGMRGAERTVLYLADALGQRGHDVVVTCAGAPGIVERGSLRIADPATALSLDYDVAISNNFASAFDGVKAPLKIIWTHNPGFSRAHIAADILAKLRHRPHLVHLSDYTRARSWFLPRSGQTIIRHGMPSELLAQRAARISPPPPIAVFSSYAGRNLRKVIEAWRDVVHQRLPAARLIVTAEASPKHLAGLGDDNLKRLNIEIAGTLPWSKLMEVFRSQARVLVAPGHFQETYNLLAVEAAACGVPVVTMGIGALRERVVHDRTGWIAGSTHELGEALVRILSDDALWERYHRASLEHPDLVNWDDRARAWESYIVRINQN
jgi:glycosyltransferase involved in cell wall biosynthesis